MPIFRKKNCIHTASGIFALCKRLDSKLVESGHVEDNSVTNILLMNKENCALKLVDEIILYVPLFFPIRAACPDHLIIFDFQNRTIYLKYRSYFCLNIK